MEFVSIGIILSKAQQNRAICIPLTDKLKEKYFVQRINRKNASYYVWKNKSLESLKQFLADLEGDGYDSY